MIARINILACVICICLVGCGGESIPELVSVTGTLTLDGEPLGNVKVTFVPEVSDGESSVRSAWGQTDSNGKYQLKYQAKGRQLDGAAEGRYKVVLEDLMPNESRNMDDSLEDIEENTPEKRIRRAYSKLSTTNLAAEVSAPGPADVNFDVQGSY